MLPDQIAAMAGQQPQGQYTQGQPAAQQAKPAEASGKLLPEDPKEFEEAISPYRPMVRPLLTMISRMSVHAGCDKLDNEEKAGGEIAFSSLIYQMGGRLDARILVLLWLISVSVPRVLEWIDKREEKRKALPSGSDVRIEQNRQLEASTPHLSPTNTNQAKAF